MTAIPVLHRSARAIGVNEFYDAVRATCPPRFPHIKKSDAQISILLAISGGVDSMALAFLFRQLRNLYPLFRVADNQFKPRHVIVDHGLREDSDMEALRVKMALKRIGCTETEIHTIKWQETLGPDVNPNDVANIETLARIQRYRQLGLRANHTRSLSLFTAHHQDDQYETVLMRLLQGSGYDNLQGISPANDIPECDGMYGVSKSGLIEDQRLRRPVLPYGPNWKTRRALRKSGLETDRDALEAETRAGIAGLDLAGLAYGNMAGVMRTAPSPPTMEFEDAGLFVYHPLLEFSKDRLIATCVENGVPWFEDHTNTDPTLTMRNAIRHLVKNHRLPVALQKPAVLQLAKRCAARVAREEAEAGRLLLRSPRVTIREFEPATGTLVVELRDFPRPGRHPTSPARCQRRRDHNRGIAATMLRRLISLVAPDTPSPQPRRLDELASRLFPSLATDTEPVGKPNAREKPKGYTIGGVLFAPLIGNFPLRWLLCRTPHETRTPPPKTALQKPHSKVRYQKHHSEWPLRALKISDWKLFDGRYWIASVHRLPYHLYVAPFDPREQQAFRKGLPEDTKRRLKALLARYARGSVRSVLPAIYAKGDAISFMKGIDNYWPNEFDGDPDRFEEASQWEVEQQEKAPSQLLALPTLGIALPGVDEYVHWDIRYRKVDREVMERILEGNGRQLQVAALKKHAKLWPRERRVRGLRPMRGRSQPRANQGQGNSRPMKVYREQ